MKKGSSQGLDDFFKTKKIFVKFKQKSICSINSKYMFKLYV